jgi:hypothetical protein
MQNDQSTNSQHQCNSTSASTARLLWYAMADTQCCSFPLALLPSIAPPPLSLMLLLLLTLVPRIPWRLLRTTLASAVATSWLATAAALNCCLAPPFEVLRKV